MFPQLTPILGWTLTVCWLVAAIEHEAPVDLVVRSNPGKTASNTLLAIRRYLSSARLEGRETKFSNSTSLDTGFDNAILFKYEQEAEAGVNVTASAGIEVVCTKCYIKGKASAHLTIDGTFNATKVATDIGNEFEETFDNITAYAKNYVSGVVDNLSDGLDADDFDFPPLNITFDLDVPSFPEASLGFGFEDLEIYMQLDTTLSAGLSYTLNLYTSTTPLGSKIGDDLLVGVVFSIDLILSVESELQMSSGFHLRMDDDVGFNIALFSKNVSSVNFKGGQFEFLPVIIESAGVELKAVLRAGFSAGIEISSPVDSKEIELFNNTIKVPGASAGIEVSVYANIAELSTNVTALSTPDEDGCVLRAVNAYQFALGAAAGASVQIGDPHLGAAASVSASATGKEKRQEELTTTTLSKKVTYTGIECLTMGLINCPPQLQTLRKFVATETFVTAVASGVEAVFPVATKAVVQDVVSFGSNAQSLISSSGVPKEFTPSPSASATSTNPPGVLDGEVGGVDKKIIVGVSIGAGVIFMALVVGACMFWQQKRRYSPVSRTNGEVTYVQDFRPSDFHNPVKDQKQTQVNVVNVNAK
ncbi:glycolate oxidase [Colletotrichum scovillei]|uniref:Glycolate oxidase n=1 Tax=Colletotrichum scovillei TaxID=1209932 RepID=A0A9P7RJ61_9PEZI|nr:glycolate oxidase [Colletotrichum scovillei]KAG7075888.1 glycolate oxidase [Colletotrichum scovillei]